MTGLKATLCVVLVFLSLAVSAQTSSSDPQAIATRLSVLQAVTAGIAVTDLSLQGSVIKIAGSDNLNGTAVLETRGITQSRFEVDFSNQKHVEVRNATGGSWTDETGVVRSIAGQNLAIDAGWFYPTFSLLESVTDPAVVFSYVGQETRNGVSVQHIHVYRMPSSASKGTAPLLQHLTEVDYYFDSNSYLPVAMIFNAHPDNNANIDIPNEIRFADYRLTNGVQIPFRVQRLINNSLVFDFTINSANVNSGLLTSDFTLQ